MNVVLGILAFVAAFLIIGAFVEVRRTPCRYASAITAMACTPFGHCLLCSADGACRSVWTIECPP